MTTDKTPDIRAESPAARAEIIGPPASVQLPAVVPPMPNGPAPRRWLRRALLALVLLIAAAAGAATGGFTRDQALPPGIASGNGRLEADEIDIDTKFAGRIAKLFADEGDLVKAGQVVAVMDTRDLEASLKKSQRWSNRRSSTLDEAKANLVQQQTQVKLRAAGARPHQRPGAERLRHGGVARSATQQHNGAVAAAERRDATGRRRRSTRSMPRRTMSSSTRSTSPTTRWSRRRMGRSNTASPMSARFCRPAARSSRCSTPPMSTWTSICRPRRPAGSGSAPRRASCSTPIPVTSIPAKVVFIASQAQFTPKTVETKDERDKLMFRIRVRIDPERLEGRAAMVRSGLPGVAYVRTDPSVAWPPQLQPSAPPPMSDAANAARSRSSTASPSVTARRVALDDVTLAIPGGLHGRADRARRRRQVDAAGASSPAPGRSSPGSVSVLGGDMADAAHRAAVCPRIAYMPQGLGKNLYPDLSVRENIEFFGRLFGQSRGRAASGASPSCSTAPGSRRSPTARRRSCRAACGRSSAFAAR